jgi:hypothetical protein
MGTGMDVKPDIIENTEVMPIGEILIKVIITGDGKAGKNASIIDLLHYLYKCKNKEQAFLLALCFI